MTSVPKLKSTREYAEAITELRDMVPAESQYRMFDLLTAVVEYVTDDARVKTLREAAELGRELSRQGYSAQEIAKKLDRKADAMEGGAS
ncbi:hypothetical protein C9F11_37860 [Streptomyces sp. YIM 121038]|uniref:hypothetical protein n=1 Tax=Streptomyces sp. YIM 121038 TaxID=2136401 RepID=UPI00111078C5|nr:hypothetical protein [Streptomyces sp. YIM 121038]QCX81155.1 hypothetical protein C9F11_37860 [Streptomyces sp. YIM 121038]